MALLAPKAGSFLAGKRSCLPSKPHSQCLQKGMGQCCEVAHAQNMALLKAVAQESQLSLFHVQSQSSRLHFGQFQLLATFIFFILHQEHAFPQQTGLCENKECFDDYLLKLGVSNTDQTLLLWFLHRSLKV